MSYDVNLPKLDSRLRTALTYIRSGKRLADIGTDHAYLPIYAVASGLSSFAIASDIGKGPAERARLHVASYGISDKIAVLCTDGLHGIEAYSPDDIIIFGMGGELIAKIISEAEFVCKKNVRLILQPMTCADILRVFLADNGFNTIGETLSEADGRQYVTIACEYDGKKRKLSPAEALLGAYNIEHNSSNPLFTRLLDRVEKAYKVRLDGKKTASLDVSEEETVLSSIYEIKNRIISK